MNEKLKELINAVGMMTELWMISYSGFKKQGMPEKEACQQEVAKAVWLQDCSS